MIKNLNLTNGLFFSQRVLLELTSNGFTREQAYAIVQKKAMETWKSNSSFYENVANDKSLVGTKPHIVFLRRFSWAIQFWTWDANNVIIHFDNLLVWVNWVSEPVAQHQPEVRAGLRKQNPLNLHNHLEILASIQVPGCSKADKDPSGFLEHLVCTGVRGVRYSYKWLLVLDEFTYLQNVCTNQMCIGQRLTRNAI